MNIESLIFIVALFFALWRMCVLKEPIITSWTSDYINMFENAANKSFQHRYEGAPEPNWKKFTRQWP